MDKNQVLGCGCLGFIAFVAAVIVLGLTVGDKKPQFEPVKSTPVPENYVEVKATDLAYSYHNNEVNADKRYNGKIFIITGQIKDIGKTITGAPYVVLKGDEKNSAIQTNIDVQVIFERSETDKIATLARGSTIKAKAECDGLTLGNVVLSDAQLR